MILCSTTVNLTQGGNSVTVDVVRWDFGFVITSRCTRVSSLVFTSHVFFFSKYTFFVQKFLTLIFSSVHQNFFFVLLTRTMISNFYFIFALGRIHWRKIIFSFRIFWDFIIVWNKIFRFGFCCHRDVGTCELNLRLRCHNIAWFFNLIMIQSRNRTVSYPKSRNFNDCMNFFLKFFFIIKIISRSVNWMHFEYNSSSRGFFLHFHVRRTWDCTHASCWLFNENQYWQHRKIFLPIICCFRLLHQFSVCITCYDSPLNFFGLASNFELNSANKLSSIHQGPFAFIKLTKI